MINIEKVLKSDVGVRLDLVLMTIRPDITRSTIKQIIISGLVTVSGKHVMPNYRLKLGEQIEIKDREIASFVRQGGTEEILKPIKMDLEIIYEDDYIIVIDKLAGINSHPVVKKDNISILNGVVYYIKNQNKFSQNVRPRLVHRLDKETSGILLISKDLKANDFYSKQFQNREAHKVYYAVVHGDFKLFLEKKGLEKLVINSYISNESNEQNQYTNTNSHKGKIAKTTVQFADHFNKFGKYKFSLVKVTPETGRTHQIRVHLSSKGFPLLGDKLYGGQKYKRLMLHAYSLKIPIYKLNTQSKEYYTFISELPKEFNT